MRRRTAVALATIGGLVGASVGGFVAGSRITSPAEIASRTAAPEPAPILVRVEERVLSTTVVSRGTGRFGSPRKLTVTPSALKPNHGLVVELPIAGTQLLEGRPAVTASGRPLFVLVGERPMSRDLGPGLAGDDVRQLEQALGRLGFRVGNADGIYDAHTEAAVAAWYRSRGFVPFTATADQLAAIGAREAGLAAAEVDLVNAGDAIASAKSTLAAARLSLRAARARTQRAAGVVDRVRAEGAAANAVVVADVTARQAMLDALRTGSSPRRATAAEIAVAEADVATARANEVAVRANGARALAEAQANVDRAPGRLSAAINAATVADSAAAADVAARQAALAAAVTAPLLADGQTIDVARAQAQIASAQSDLASAKAAAENVRVTGAEAIADAQSALDRAMTILDSVRSQTAAAESAVIREVEAKQAILDALKLPPPPVPPTPAEIATAERDLAVAVANGDSVRLSGERAEKDALATADEAAAEVDAKVASLLAAEIAIANATRAARPRSSMRDVVAREVELARRRAGVQVPADEIAFVSRGPVRVSQLLVGPGDPVVGGIMTVTDSLVHIDGGLTVADAGLVRPGLRVQIDEPDLGIAASGLVKTVAPGPGTNGVDGFHVYVEIEVAAPPPNLVGASVRLTIPVDSTRASALVVPLSALTLAPDGSSRVQRRVAGVEEFVNVRAGLSADGYVAVAAVDGANPLKVGDLVVVGLDQPTGATKGTSRA